MPSKRETPTCNREMFTPAGSRSGARARRPAFTLIELLVVIAIIALLVSILLPSLQRAQKLAKQAVCGTRLRGLGFTLNMHANDNNDRYLGRECAHTSPPCCTNLLPTYYNYPYGEFIGAWNATKYLYLGRLFAMGRVETPELLFCPDAPPGVFDYQSQWLDTSPQAGSGGRTSYSYRCAITDFPGLAGGTDSSFDEVGNGCLLFDFDPNWHDGNQNVCYANGSVLLVTDQDPSLYSNWALRVLDLDMAQ